jgi:broad specificity phosphatase PhoE
MRVRIEHLRPLSAANSTIPESPDTLKIQLRQLAEGNRRAVMIPKGTPLPKRPAGMKSYQDADGNVFIFNPKLTSQPEIDRAAAENRLPDILGPADGGMGVPDKTELRSEPVAVVAKDANGETAQGSIADQQSAPRAIEQARKVTPPGGSVEVGSPKDELAHRIAANAGGEVTRGTSDIPMTDEGRTEVAKLGESFARKGGLDKVYRGPLERTRDTAALVGGDAPQIEVEGLRPWALGDLEGQPHAETKDTIESLMKDRPNVAPPGQGPLSEYPGESHQQFVSTVAGAMRPILNDFERDPSQRIGVVTHSRDLRALRALVDGGFPATERIDPRALDEKVPDPGEVARLTPGKDGWRLEKADISGDAPLEPGIYIIRHGETEWNKGGASKPPRPAEKPRPLKRKPAKPAVARSNPADTIYRLVRQSKFQEAIDAAMRAVESGALTDSQVDAAIDRAEADMGRPLPQWQTRSGVTPPPPFPRIQ